MREYSVRMEINEADKAHMLKRFNESFKKCPEHECWIWTGSMYRDGYGRVRAGDKSTAAHRFSWLLCHGQIPAGKFVCHTCDVRACVNPSHLYIGNHSENMRDMVGKNCMFRQILTVENVREIKNSKEHANILAKRYGVGPTAIYNVRSGFCWGWVKA